MKMRSKQKTLFNRRNAGSSLLLVTCIGTIALMMAMAVIGSLIDVYRHTASQLAAQQVSSVAESSMQYTLALINDAARNEQLGEVPSTVDIPSSVSGGLNTKAEIADLDVTDLALLQAPYFDRLIPQNMKIYKKVTVTVTNGIDKSKIVSIIGPDLFDGKSPSGSVPFFQNALQGVNSVTLGSGADVTSLDASPNFSNSLISSSADLVLNDNQIQGSVSAGNNITADSNVKIFGNVTYGNTASPTLISDSPIGDPAASPTDSNVLGDGVLGDDPDPTNPSPSQFGTITKSASTNTVTPAPSPESSGSASFTGDSSSLSASPPAGASADGVYDLGAVNLSSGQSLTLAPGNYSASSFNMGPGSTVQIGTDTTSSTGVKLYIQGNTPGNSAMSIDSGSTFSNPNSANNFQVFYNGNKNISVNTNSSFSGLVYAPNANVAIKSSQPLNPTQINGAFVANDLSVDKNVNVKFSSSSTNTTGGGGGNSAGPGYTAINPAKITFKALSWQEFPKNQIP